MPAQSGDHIEKFEYKFMYADNEEAGECQEPVSNLQRRYLYHFFFADGLLRGDSTDRDIKVKLGSRYLLLFLLYSSWKFVLFITE